MAVNLSVASGCGAITWMRSLSSSPVGAGIDDEGGNALRAGRLAGAGEEDVEIGDAAVRDIGLGAVDDVSRRRPARRVVSIAATSEPDVGLGQREGGDLLAFGDRGQIGLLLRFGAEQADRARSQPLHGEGEIGEARMAGERLADQRERADVEATMICVCASTASCGL